MTKKAQISKPEPEVIKKSEDSKQIAKPSRRSQWFKKIEWISKKDKNERGVLYVGHLPYGFNEDEIKEFFTQFGEVTRYRVARSKKTAWSKGYCFVEFKEKDVAEAACKALQNRPMLKRSLVTSVLSELEIHPELFKNCNWKFRYVPNRLLNSKEVNKEKDDDSMANKVQRLLDGE